LGKRGNAWANAIEREEFETLVRVWMQTHDKCRLAMKFVLGVSACCMILKGFNYVFDLYKGKEKKAEVVPEAVAQSWDPHELARGRFVRSTFKDWQERENAPDRRDMDTRYIGMTMRGQSGLAKDVLVDQAGKLDDEMSKLRRNMVKVTMGERFVYGFSFGGSQVVFPVHVFCAGEGLLKDEVEMCVEEGSKVFRHFFRKANMTILQSRGAKADFCLYDFGLAMQPKAFMQERLLSDDEILCVQKVEGLFVGRKKTEADPLLMVLEAERNDYEYESKKGQFYSPGNWRYGPKVEGDCGKLLVAEVKGVWRVLGFHIASRRENGVFVSGVGCVLTKEIVRQALKVQGSVVVSQAGIETSKGVVGPAAMVDAYENKYTPQCDLVLLGKLLDCQFVDGRFQWRDLPYLQEPWHTGEFWPSVTGTRHPLVRGFTPEAIFQKSLERVHKSSETKLLPTAVVEMSIRDVFDKIGSVKPDRDVRVMTMDEMVNGRGGMAALCMNSSEGYPYTKRRPSRMTFPDGSERPVKGKRWMFSESEDGKRVVLDDELRADVAIYDNFLRGGIAPPFVWTAILKDELRTKQKVLDVNTRVVIGSPVSLTMLCRKYFGALLDHVFSNPCRFGIAVGMNVYSAEWDDMMRVLLRNSKKGFDGDFKFFERYFNAQFAEVVLSCINAWYRQDPNWNEADDVARRTIFYVMMYAYMVTGNVVYKTWCLLLSGGYLTTLINSIMSNALIRMAFVLVALDKMPNLASMEHFRKLVACMTFGDDIIVSVSGVAKWFNVFSMSKKLGEYNIYFTAGNKTVPDEASQALSNLLECEFLKQTTLIGDTIPGVKYYPCALDDSLMKTLCYSSSTLDVREATIVNGNDVLGRVWSSGFERFAMWRERIWGCWRRLGIAEVPLSYEDLKHRWEMGEIRSDVFCPYTFGDGYSYVSAATMSEFVEQSGKADIPETATVVPTDVTPVVSIGDSSVDTKVSGYDVQVPSVGTLIKRSFPIRAVTQTDVSVTIPLGSPFLGTMTESDPLLNSPGLLRYFGLMYRMYSGNMRFHVLLNREVAISASMSSDNIPVVRYFTTIGDNICNAPVAFGSRTLDIQAPYVSRYPMLRSPWFNAEIGKDTSSGGTLTLSFTRLGSEEFVGLIHVGAADGFRFAGLCRLPTLTILGTNYPHFGGTAVDVEEFVEMKSDAAGFDIPLTQMSLDTWAPIRALTLPATGIDAVTSFTVSSANLPDKILRVLGYAIKDGQPRNVLTGVTASLNVNMDAFVLYTVPYTYTISATPSATVGDPGVNFKAVGTGTTYSFVDKWGMNNQLATTWTTHTENWQNPPWRVIVGLPPYALLVANNDSATASVPMTAEYESTGYTYKRWSNGPLIALGFGAPTLKSKRTTKVKFSEDRKHDFAVVHVGQSGKVTIVGTPPVVSDGGVETKVNVMTMGEDVPSNIGIVGKEQLVESVTWNTSNAAGTALTYYEAPFDLIKSLVMKSAFSRYVFWRGDVTLRVQMQSNQFMNGSIVVAWMPLMNSAQALILNNGNLRSLSVTKHVILYAGSCSTVDLTVPFLHNKGHLDLRVNTEDNMLGTFVVYVQNPLRVGPTATVSSVTLSIFASFNNCDFAVINPTNVSIVPQGGIQSKVTNINIEHAVNSTLDASTTGDNFQGGSTSGNPMDLPNIGLNFMPTNNKSYPVICNTRNVDYCVVLDTEAGARPSIKPAETGTTVDEMELKYLTEKLSFVSSFVLSSTNVLGESLFVADLCPAFELFNLPFGAAFTPTLLSYVSFPFSFWKGSLVYKIVAVASPVHTARLQICSHVGYEASGLDVNQAFGQYICIFEVRGVSEITLSFPWRSSTEWKKVNTGSNSDTASYSMGQFSVRVLNGLQSMESVSADIDLNVYMAGGPDYDLSYLGNNAIDLSPADTPM